MTDVPTSGERDHASVELELRFDNDDPPSGSVRRAGEDTAEPDGAADPGVPFVGWLGLLAALDELTQPAD